MATRRRWRPWVAAAVTAGLAGAGTLVFGGGGNSPAASPGPAGTPPAAERPAPPDHQVLPAALVVSGTAQSGAAAGRRSGHRALSPDATGGQIQLPGPGTRPAPAQPDTVTAGPPDPGGSRPAWRALLESRWQQRLATLTGLALTYHDAADRLPGAHGAGDRAAARQLRRLMRETVAARRALSDTEEALARLSGGRFGRCEQCAAAIAVTQLVEVPETRYCARCTHTAAMTVPPVLHAHLVGYQQDSRR